MKIPVFVSCPTTLNDQQSFARKLITRELDRANLEARALGRSDYPTELPLREVLLLARHCAGGIILGFEQIRLKSGTSKRGTSQAKIFSSPMSLPSPWNHLEAGILYSLGLPILVFKEDGISGGVFDPGVSDVFIHRMPESPISTAERKALSDVFQKWQASVRSHYYQ